MFEWNQCKHQYEKYNKLGYFFRQNFLNNSEISKVKNEMQNINYGDLPGTILEKDLSLKSIHGIHLYSNVVDELSRHPKILKPVTTLLKGKVYIHQSKLNRKSAFKGSSYPWHQDYTHWYYEDKIPKSAMINVAIFLDEVNEFNSPIFLIPRSHNQSKIGYENKESKELLYSNNLDWTQNTTDIKYPVGRKIAQDLIMKNGIDAPKGKAGSVLFFHVDCVHGSANNISPFKRDILLLTYNRVDNIPEENTYRPEYLASKNYQPLEELNISIKSEL